MLARKSFPSRPEEDVGHAFSYRVCALAVRLVLPNVLRHGLKQKQARFTILEATQGQIDGFFSQLPYKCQQNRVASVGV